MMTTRGEFFRTGQVLGAGFPFVPRTSKLISNLPVTPYSLVVVSGERLLPPMKGVKTRLFVRTLEPPFSCCTRPTVSLLL